MKTKSILLSLAVVATLFVGCGQNANTNAAKKPEVKTEEKAPEKADVVTTASIVNKADAFEKAISKDGTWIIATLNDITIDKELVLEGEFKNGKKNEDGTDAIQRKIALYTQDENKKVTASFTLTAPKLTIKSPKARIQNGTFKGDLYVETKDFQLVGATVEGNVYFASEEAKAGFKMDDKSKVTGTQEVKK
jgi:PBP1b-binding outer membrane lipoprotein LpoB